MNWQPVGGHNSPCKTKGLDRPTYAGTPIETIGENLNSSNLQNGAENENPGALAGATGVRRGSAGRLELALSYSIAAVLS